jgi:hypothetical protein
MPVTEKSEFGCTVYQYLPTAGETLVRLIIRNADIFTGPDSSQTTNTNDSLFTLLYPVPGSL